MTANATHPSTTSRATNGMLGVVFCAFFLASYWPVIKVIDLSRADLEFHGIWIGGHARKITAVTPGGVADRAGLRAGDVIEFNPARDADWVLAGYRNMPEGFIATLPVRHVDGSRSLVTLAPERVGYLPTLNDRLALVVRLVGVTILLLICLAMVWVRPSVMIWSL